ncbi:hypothetical protein ACXR2U_14810 [Jatrophihabitans sp. YIM 134969]
MTRAVAPARPSATVERSPLYSAIIGVASLVVLLQAVWAGLFIHEGQDYSEGWVEVHARGADVAIGLGVVAAIVAFVKLRGRRDLQIGTVLFVIALVVEAYIGGLIGDTSSLTVVHFPLAMVIMGLAVWLPLRATRRG